MSKLKLDEIVNWACCTPRIEALYDARAQNDSDKFGVTRQGFTAGYRVRQQMIWKAFRTPFHAIFGTGKMHACSTRSKDVDGTQIAKGIGLFGLVESVTLYPLAAMTGIVVGTILGALVGNPVNGAGIGGLCGLTLGVTIGTTLRELAALLTAGSILVLITPVCAWSGLRALTLPWRQDHLAHSAAVTKR